MTSLGYIKLHRQVQDHWLFRQRRRFSYFEAWVDLLFLATFEEHVVPIKGCLYELKRGDVLWSQRQLAKRWRWSEKKLRGFLKMLEKDGMILLHILPHRITQISICNYTHWQDWGRTEDGTDARSRDAPLPHRYRRNKKGKKGKNIITDEHKRQSEDLYNYYVTNIHSGAKKTALRSIANRLTEKTFEELRSAIDNYRNNGMAEDPEYRIRPQNFFGRAERFREYLVQTDHSDKKPQEHGLTATERYLLEKSGQTNEP